MESGAEHECWYVVFDARSGRVVHSHKFIEASDRRDDPPRVDAAVAAAREAMVRQAATDHSSASSLQVRQIPPGSSIEPGVLYRVDLETGTLAKAAEAPRTMQEYVARARARKARRAEGTA
jgi:hypothetical protein